MYTIGLISESTPESNITWLLWIALVFFAIMVLVGWLVSRKKEPEEEQVHGSHDQHPADAHAESDNLTK